MAHHIDNDETAGQLRDEITAADVAILELVNRRVELVQRLRDHKIANGYPMVDASREEWLINHLLDKNAGPISDDGVRRLIERLIELVKSEVYDELGSTPS